MPRNRVVFNAVVGVPDVAFVFLGAASAFRGLECGCMEEMEAEQMDVVLCLFDDAVNHSLSIQLSKITPCKVFSR